MRFRSTPRPPASICARRGFWKWEPCGSPRGRIEGAGSFHQLINPQETIPAFSTAIHGIDNEKVAGAPYFAAMWPQLQAFLGDAVIIGHTIGFDLAMLAQECKRAGLPFEKPRSLDTQFLAQLVNPRLTGQSLGQLADWLKVEITDRHSALGDALTTARVFQAMVPKLRDGGIRTYAEAAQACRSLTEVIDRQYRAGWMTLGFGARIAIPSRCRAGSTVTRIATASAT